MTENRKSIRQATEEKNPKSTDHEPSAMSHQRSEALPRVHILPPEIISKIAAGEVIERPASVVKELLENSLDAGTDMIELHLKQAGKTLIRLKDSGAGIASEDLPQVFHRHSTSKISSIDDLFQIRSLGFRGEALYSVAAIADIILRSRTEGQDSGWEIHMRGSEQLDLKPTALARGTEIEVKELFFNTPARRKFLRSNITEMNQILNVFVPYTLLCPRIRFLLTHDGKTQIDLLPEENHVQRISASLNLDSKHLLSTKEDFPDDSLSVHMILGDINIVRSRRDLQFVFVNGRPVQSKAISFHMNNVFRLVLPQGNYPFFALFLDIPPENVDANIHPTKREVKIRDEQNICSLLRRMAERLLMSKGAPKAMTDGEQSSPAASAFKDALSREHRDDLPFEHAPLPDQWDEEKTGGLSPTEQYSFPRESALFAGEHLSGEKRTGLRAKMKGARYIGQFMQKYLFFESGKTMLIVDQHAAQERIAFELLIQQMERGQVEIQHLLSPYLVKLSPQDLLSWESAKDRLELAGFATTLFDEEAVAIHTYPVLLRDPERAVRDILAGGDAARCDHETIARRACRSSVMSGDPLKKEQAVFQKEELISCRDPFTCPHGRPTVIEMTLDHLDKQFLRT